MLSKRNFQPPRHKKTRRSLNPCFNGICSRSRIVAHTDGFALNVLILVLMEYALEGPQSWTSQSFSTSLNPCFNGICSRSQRHLSTQKKYLCLNPCFNGICSRSCCVRYALFCPKIVLILVLMEYALEATPKPKHNKHRRKGLNPCFNGICSRSISMYAVASAYLTS